MGPTHTDQKDRQARGPPNTNKGAAGGASAGGATHHRLVVEGDKRGSCQGPAAEGLKSPAGPPNSGERPAGAGATQHEHESAGGGHPPPEPLAGPPNTNWRRRPIVSNLIQYTFCKFQPPL